MAFVKTEVQGAVEIITIDRPKALNALNPEVLADLKAAFEAVDQDAIRCIVLTGEGDKSFVAGADIGSMSTMTKAEGEAFGKLGNDVFLMIEHFPIPVIAAVNGFALGGGNEITREVIAKIVTRDLDYVVFEVLDQFIANRATDGLRTLNGLMENGEKPLMIAERLRDKAKLTLQARQLLDKRIGKDEITRRLGVSSGYAWRVSDSAKRLSTAQVAALTDAAEALSRVTTMQLTGKAKAEDALIRALMLLAHR